MVGVIDHHRVADFQTRSPAFMRMEPVGATSTIVGKLFIGSRRAGAAVYRGCAACRAFWPIRCSSAVPPPRPKTDG